jgi:hypothetical protein
VSDNQELEGQPAWWYFLVGLGCLAVSVIVPIFGFLPNITESRPLYIEKVILVSAVVALFVLLGLMYIRRGTKALRGENWWD